MRQAKAILASWARSFLAACAACYMAGVTDPKLILNSGLAAVLPVVIAFLNPKDDRYGLGA